MVELYRNKFGLVLLIVMPLFMMGMVGFIYPTSGSSASNLPVAIVNLDAGYNNSTIGSQTFTSVLQQINGKTEHDETHRRWRASRTVKASIQRGKP